MKLRLYTILMLAALTFCTSCESWLDMDPKDGLPGGKVLSTLSGNESLLLSAYDQMQSEGYYGRNLICAPEILADNCGQRAGGTMFTDAYYNRPGSGVNLWVRAYGVIAVANDVLAAIDNVAIDVSETGTRDKIKGEAYFLRGLAYFDLLKVYAREPYHLVDNFDLGVPQVTKPLAAMGPDAYGPRADIYTIWQQIEDDLTQAFTLLQDNDSKNFPQRGNSYAAKAILARAYLYQSKWQDAASAASWVIQNKPILYSGNYKDIFTSSKESLFELKYTTPETLGNASLNSIYGTQPDVVDGRGYGELIMGTAILGMFETGDKRISMRRSHVDNGVTIWWNTKFNSWQGTFGQDNVPIVRIAEMYLIRAEASLKLPTPDYTTARGDIDVIRTTRGLGVTTVPDASLLSAADKERRLELCFEGHRLFDLKRQGKDIPKEGGQAAIPYTDYRVVAGIPQTDIDVNKNLVNNPGY